MKKALFLFIAVMFPIVVILFLRIFGESEYEIPVYYDDSVLQLVGCEEAALPYHFVPEYNINPRQRHATVLALVPDADSLSSYVTELFRLNDKFPEDDDAHILIAIKGKGLLNKIAEVAEYDLQQNNMDFIELTKEEFENLYRCKLFLPQGTEDAGEANTVLIDKQSRIRGYYNLLRRTETDRLSAETKILLQSYD